MSYVNARTATCTVSSIERGGRCTNERTFFHSTKSRFIHVHTVFSANDSSSSTRVKRVALLHRPFSFSHVRRFCFFLVSACQRVRDCHLRCGQVCSYIAVASFMGIRQSKREPRLPLSLGLCVLPSLSHSIRRSGARKYSRPSRPPSVAPHPDTLRKQGSRPLCAGFEFVHSAAPSRYLCRVSPCSSRREKISSVCFS